jgi:nucleoside-diphosphate-sugar epimerase
MNKNESLKIKNQVPISIIVHGGDYLGFLLAQTLLEQGSQVVIIDKYTSDTKKYANLLKRKGDVTFINFKGSKSFFENIGRIDYLYYNLTSELEYKETLESKDFLIETDNLNLSLKYAQKFKAKISVISSLRLNRELANRVNNDNLSQPTPYSNIELQKYCENLVAEFRDQTKANLRIIRLGTVLGKGIEKISDESLHNLLLDGTSKNQIEIHGEGLDIHNIIDENDAVYGILKLTFSEKTRGEVITLANRNDYTTLSMAYKLLELNVSAQTIKFIADQNARLILQDLYVPAPNAIKYGWKQQALLENTLIDQIHKYYELNDKSWNIPTKESQNRNSNSIEITTKKGELFNKIKGVFKRKSEGKLFSEINYGKITLNTLLVVLSFLFIYFLLSPILGMLIGGTLIYRNVDNLKTDILNYEFNNAQKDLNTIKNHIGKIKKNSDRLDWIFVLLNKGNLITEIDKIFLGLDYAVESGDNLITGLTPLASYVKDFKPAINFDSTIPTTTREYRDYLDEIDQNTYLTNDGTYKLNLANEVISSVKVEYFPKYLQPHLVDFKLILEDTTQSIQSVNSIISFLPEVLGNTERKRFLILLQNEGEIRSTGGWISSYGIVGIEGGQIRELFVDDIYNADGTLKVQNKRFAPPQSFANALEITDYSFSLVNWYPDLYNVLLESESFVAALGKGDDLDGLLTIDISFIQKLLDKWGGIEVPGEPELITSENLYTKIFDMHEEFTPGSSQKATFLANLANETVTKILSSDFNGYKDIVSVFIESLDEKHLQAVFKDSEATKFFDDNNWDGQLDSKYSSAPINIDWNWGGNKANLYIKKDHNLDIVIDENDITYTYEINVVNESTKDIYPEGIYENYIRIYIPSGAKILSIEGIDNNEYDIYNENGFQVVGGWFNTDIQSSNNFLLKYKISQSDLGSYFPISKVNNSTFFDLNLYKQPGSKKESYVLNIAYPQDWNILENDGLTTISNQLTRRFDLVSDSEFEISWTTP